MKINKDMLGQEKIPDNVLWGIHTFRAKNNFNLLGYQIPDILIKSLGLVKKACLLTNSELGYIKKEKTESIKKAIDDLIDGKLNEHIIVDALQGGAGTSTNMNINEVIANQANIYLGKKTIHPLEDINLHQSTNDVYPTAVKIGILYKLRELSDMISKLQEAFQLKEEEFSDIIKLGRTEMQDAVPLTLGAEFGAFADVLARDRWRVFKCEERIRTVNIGGTAIGTGITAPKDYIFLVIEKLREVTELNLARYENLIDGTQNNDTFAEVSGILKTYALNLIKIAKDLILMSSGPYSGFNEINLPEVQAGSSIMPEKVNPVILEMIIQIGYKVISNDYLICESVASGTLELNSFLPLISFSFFETLDLLISSTKILTEKCILGITANKEICKKNVFESWSIATVLLSYIGYDKTLDLIKESKKQNIKVIDLLYKKNIFSKEEIDTIFSAQNLMSLGYKEKK